MSSPSSRNGVVALVLAGALIVVLYLLDTNRHLYRMGKAVACKDDSVFEGAQAEILEYGLQDVRGLTTDSSQRFIYMAEANREVLIYDTLLDRNQVDAQHPAGGFINSDHDLICRDGECENLDDRDIAIVGNQAYITEDGKAKISIRVLGVDHKLNGWRLWDPKWADAIDTPSGISVIEHRIFISTETPSRFAHGTASDPKKRDGALYVACEVGDCQPDLIGDTLQHPSGVVSTGPNGPVYVVDDGGDSVRYSIYRKVLGRGWIQDGLLASVPKGGQEMPRFLGIAFSKVKQMIFAAGPGGIYAFDAHGASLGRMVFDQPVSGVTVSDENRYLYLAVGSMLCRISFDRVIETNRELPAKEVIHLEKGQHDPTIPDFDPILTAEVIKPADDHSQSPGSKTLKEKPTELPAGDSHGPSDDNGSHNPGSNPPISKPPSGKPQRTPELHVRHNGVPSDRPSGPCRCCCNLQGPAR
jgi:hypothetical protein